MFHLIGRNDLVPDWVVKVKQRPDLGFHFNYADDPALTASPWPILKSNQLPHHWLHEDPGFPVLLRDFSPNVAEDKSWIYLPSIKGFRFSRQYSLKTLPKKNIFRTLIILRTSQASLLNEMLLKFSDRELRWIFLDRPSNEQIESPSEFKKELYCYQGHWRPDSVISLCFDQIDTYTPYHLHSLHLGAFLEELELGEKGNTIAKRPCWYGTWEIFQVIL